MKLCHTFILPYPTLRRLVHRLTRLPFPSLHRIPLPLALLLPLLLPLVNRPLRKRRRQLRDPPQPDHAVPARAPRGEQRLRGVLRKRQHRVRVAGEPLQGLLGLEIPDAEAPVLRAGDDVLVSLSLHAAAVEREGGGEAEPLVDVAPVCVVIMWWDGEVVCVVERENGSTCRDVASWGVAHRYVLTHWEGLATLQRRRALSREPARRWRPLGLKRTWELWWPSMGLVGC